MPTIYPFQGFRFNPAQAGPVTDLVTQPYDKIPDELRSNYLKRSPYNIVRVIRNPDYQEAASFLNRWIEEGILVSDAEPGIYLYEQVFEFEGQRLSRLGLICLVALDDEDLVVKGHEKVLDKPLADRLNLIRQTEANEGLIFTLFSDREQQADRILREFAERQPPVIEVVDDFQVVNRIWIATSPEVIGTVRASLKGKPLYIADGHHRFMTSVLFNRECAAAGKVPLGPESFDKRMIAIFNMESEGMRILPTHRGICGLGDFQLSGLLKRLEPFFSISASPDPNALYREVETSDHCIGLVAFENGRWSTFSARLRPSALDDPGFMPSIEGPLRKLDVTLLHSGILADGLGISPEVVASGRHVEYFREREELLSRIESGKLQLGCLLRSTSLDQVREIAEDGLRMPQKSTDFFPKLLTGLVLMKMKIGSAE